MAAQVAVAVAAPSTSSSCFQSCRQQRRRRRCLFRRDASCWGEHDGWLRRSCGQQPIPLPACPSPLRRYRQRLCVCAAASNASSSTTSGREQPNDLGTQAEAAGPIRSCCKGKRQADGTSPLLAETAASASSASSPAATTAILPATAAADF